MSEPRTCVVDVNSGARSVPCHAGMTLFAALRTQSVLLPTGCGARGQCGQCKVTLLAGEADIMTDSEARLIPEPERALGKRLACQLRIRGDIRVRIPEYVFGAKDRNVVLDEVIPLTHDIKRFGFRLADGDSLPHRAGQFVTLVAKIPGQPGQVMRCFSFATSSRTTDRVDIIARRTPHGVMTPYLFEQAKAGDAFRVIAPYGDFYLREGNSPCVWIGGGSGLSPFMGMLQDLLDRGETRPVHLFFGAVYPRDLYYIDLLNKIAGAHEWFRFTPALSGDERCDFCVDYGLITDVVSKHVGDAAGAQGYLCGGPGLIAACVKLLTEKGMGRDAVFYDRF